MGFQRRYGVLRLCQGMGQNMFPQLKQLSEKKSRGQHVGCELLVGLTSCAAYSTQL